ncbi:FixH family protein [bacterium]|nr:FixH family protein [bacterium]
MNTATSNAEPLAWYRQFWPWFLISLPASVVVAGFVTLKIAIDHADSLVIDNYYKEGLAINQSMALDKIASQYGLSAELIVDGMTGEMRIDLKATNNSDFNYPSSLVLKAFHPTNSAQDFEVMLSVRTPGQYMADLEQIRSGLWYIEIAPIDSLAITDENTWRLKSEMKLTGKKIKSVTLVAKGIAENAERVSGK